MKVSMCKTMRTYEWKNLSKDLLAGLVIMAVSIPISMGYAQIAGLPAVYGLYGSVFPILLFALFSTSPQFIFGVDAAPAALVGSALISRDHLALAPRFFGQMRAWIATEGVNHLVSNPRCAGGALAGGRNPTGRGSGGHGPGAAGRLGASGAQSDARAR